MAIWECAKSNGFSIATKDSDYEQLSVMRGFPPKVVWIRTGNCTAAHLADLFGRHADFLAQFDQSAVDGMIELR